MGKVREKHALFVTVSCKQWKNWAFSSISMM